MVHGIYMLRMLSKKAQLSAESLWTHDVTENMLVTSMACQIWRLCSTTCSQQLLAFGLMLKKRARFHEQRGKQQDEPCRSKNLLL
jgi:hypothetical protein